MKQRSKKRELRRRLMTGIFCISLFAADLASAVPVWAKEPVEAEEQVQETGEEGTGETQNPTDGNQEGTAQNPDRENEGEGGGSQTQNPEDGNGGDDAQKPDEGKDGDDAQDPDEGKDGDNAQNPDEGKDGEGAQNPEDEKDGDGVTDDADAAEQEPETPDGEETPSTDDQESVSENDPDEPEISVSENDVEALGEVRALAVPADAIGSGTYGNITWVIDANGKLTVEGTGEFGNPSGNGTIYNDYNRAPWHKYASQIKTAEIKVSGTVDTSYMFYECSNLTQINLSGFDTSDVTNMKSMFEKCSNLESLDLHGFHTENVAIMGRMFFGCQKLKQLDLSGFTTGNLTDMSNMFSGCFRMQEIDLSSFDTSNVEYMNAVFSTCSFITSLDLQHFNTAKVTRMDEMFSGCFRLAKLDISSFDTGKVTTMDSMFQGCGGLTELDVRHFDTGNVTDMAHMFSSCHGLTSLDVSHFSTGNVTDMKGMFSDCHGLTSLDVSHFNTGNVTDMAYMFSSCIELTSLDVRNFDTGKVRSFGGMFIDCRGLISLDLHTFDTSAVERDGYSGFGGGMDGMFAGCSELTSLDISSFDTSHVDDMHQMFKGCSKLSRLDLHHFDTGRVTEISAMFQDCASLTELDLGSFDTSKVSDMQNMFSGCTALQKLDLGSFDTSKVSCMTYMFKGCSSLKELDLHSFDLGALRAGDLYANNRRGIFEVCDRMDTIYTPCNVQVDSQIDLPGVADGDVWYRIDGGSAEKITTLPEGLDHSVIIMRNKAPEVKAGITARKGKTAYACGETVTLDDLTVTYYGTDGSVRKLTPEQYTTNAAQIDMTEAGEKKLVVTYVNGGTSLTAEITLTVTYGLTADNTTVTLPAEHYTYDGIPKQPVPTAVSYTQNAAGGAGTPVTLSEGTDYTISYRNNINAYEPSAADGSGVASGTGTGTAAPTIIIKGAGKYSGSVTKTFAIQKAASPAAETMDVTGSQCTQANPKRTADLTGSFAACGKKTGYEILSVEDTKGIFSQTPVTVDISNGILTYGTKAAQEGDTASLKVKVSFANYKDAELTVRITMAAKKAAVISGITMEESVVYSGAPVSYGGEAAVKTEDGKDITGQISLVYQYSGTMADGTAYPAQGGTAEPPVNAGSYVLTVSVKDDNPDYVGSVSYPFAITKADAVVQAKDLTIMMQKAQGEGSVTVPVDQYKESFGYEASGLFGADRLKTEPSYSVTEDEAGTKTVNVIDTSKAGTYYIHPSGADAGMNYALAYKPGVLTVSEERVAYTVALDGMGHCDTVTKSGIRSGMLLELSESERTPAAKEQGYVFAGWFKDKTFDRKKEWNFDTDTVQSDLTLYACWLTAAQDGNGLKLCVQEIPDLTYTGNAWKPAVTVYDGDGKTLLKAGKDYTVKYVNNTNAVAVDESGRPKETGGTAKVTNPGKTNEQLSDVAGHFSKSCPYVMITGKGNYKETIYRNFLILPAQISTDTGFTLKYTDQFEAKAGKTAKIISSVKYKKALKEGKDYSVSVADASGQNVALIQGKMPLNAGSYTMTVTGKGNYTGAVIRELYVSERQKLMKNVAITLGKNQKNIAYTGKAIELTPGYYDAGTGKNYKVTAQGVISTEPEANANDMFLVKAGKESLIWGTDYTIDYAGTNLAAGTATMTLTGKNGYVGKKSVTFKITGAAFSAGTIDVKAYDAADPDEKDWKASMPYTGRAVTQNKVTLTTKVTQKNPTPEELVYGEHYTIAYKNNVKKGTATVTFTALPASGYTGSFKKTFKITPQDLTKERLTVTTPVGGDKTPEAVYCKNGARLSFTITNEAGTVLREGTDFTVKYKNNAAVTTAQTEDNKKPLMTVTGKGSYAGKVEVPFKVVQASLADALDQGIVNVSCVQVQKKEGMKCKDFKFKLVEGKKTLGAGETKDYVIDETNCTPEMIKAYADALAAGTALPQEPVVKVTGKGSYTGEKTIPLGKYIYADNLTAACVYVTVSEGAGQSEYTGRQVTPDVAVYYGEKTAVNMAKKDKEKNDAVLTAENGKYKLKKLEAGGYTVSYGANIAAGKNKGSVTITGAGRYGGSVTVKFEIGKKAIY